MRLCGISSRFQLLSPSIGQVTHALLTRPPLTFKSLGFIKSPFDLHVLSTPPAFILSQDQTLMLKVWSNLWLQKQSWLFSPASLSGLSLNLSSGIWTLDSLLFLWVVLSSKTLFSEIFLRTVAFATSAFGIFQGCITVYLSRYHAEQVRQPVDFLGDSLFRISQLFAFVNIFFKVF